MAKQTVTTVISETSGSGDEPEITISTPSLDRDFDEVMVEGADLESYRRNPVVLFGHDYGALPVGGTTAIEVMPGRGLRASWRWLEGDAFADRVKNAYAQGLLRAASIGFRVLESTPNGRGGMRFTRWELLEWSLVPVPANGEAVRGLKRLDLWRQDEPVLLLADDDADEPTAEPADVAVALCEVWPELACEIRAELADLVGRETQRLIARHRGHLDAFDGDPAAPARRTQRVAGAQSGSGNQTFEIDPDVLRDAMSDAMRECVGAALADAVTTEVRRRRGGID